MTYHKYDPEELHLWRFREPDPSDVRPPTLSLRAAVRKVAEDASDAARAVFGYWWIWWLEGVDLASKLYATCRKRIKKSKPGC